MRSRNLYVTRSDRALTLFLDGFLWFWTLVVAYPLVYVLSASLSSPQAVIGGKVWLLPVEPTLRAYQAVFRNKMILAGFANSTLYMVLGTAISLALTVFAAFPLSRRELAGRKALNALFLFTMIFSGGMIPTYLVVKDLGLRNTVWAVVLPSAFSVWNMIITRTYFQTNIPDELYEAAQLDGCSDFRFLRRVVLPLSGPILAVIGLYYAVGLWNGYFNALLYIDSQRLYPLQLVLRDILVLSNMDMSMMQDFSEMLRKQGLASLLKYAVIVVASLPVMLAYPFVQRFFVKGVMVGAMKG
ncbi:MAG TPA: carbohydrate ABC transporter permease [Spirochaetales bacterium]|nr:carbohydrate ABC transporter permease [Spirochaetales bacterium]HRY55288.1 carbohydrate ABC transporter permease [Spirochaetia bacterium]HRZ63622.1 carbohydrate ABC transporter permease [Spirochaetia bacterium]